MTFDSFKHDTLSIYSGNNNAQYCRKCGEQLCCILGAFSQPTSKHWNKYVGSCPRCGSEISIYLMKENRNGG